MAEIFMYNIKNKKAIEIKNICRTLYVEYREIDESEYSYKLSYLLKMSDNSEKRESGDIKNEMLYLIGFNDGLLNIFLKLLRSKKCAVTLKAVMTETNVNYTSYELYKEISAEHKAMQSGNSIH
ncbi:MAG: DUF3783 domain-containing protein [Ruminococcus sp.]|nr:DUF3783 domain-containing protein [Ruminococcus sp.]